MFAVWGQKVSSKDFCLCVSHITVLLVTLLLTHTLAHTLSLRFSSLANVTDMYEMVSVRDLKYQTNFEGSRSQQL